MHHHHHPHDASSLANDDTEVGSVGTGPIHNNKMSNHDSELQVAKEHDDNRDDDDDDDDEEDDDTDGTKRMRRMTSEVSNVRTRMMRNMLGGTATSIWECVVVVVAGQLLAFNSGYINGACLSGLITSSGRKQSVAAFTGSYTVSALQLGAGNTQYSGFLVCMILSFTFGACLSGLLTPKPIPYRIEPTYGPTFALGGLVLLGSSILAATPTGKSRFLEDSVFYLAAIANGIQNGISSSYSANLIRSTHLTGTSTDIGLFLGQLLRGNREHNWKLVVLMALALSFWTGGLVSYYATKHLTTQSLLFNAGLFFVVGILLVVFMIHEYHVTVLQALFGTWKWKRILHELKRHHTQSDFVVQQQQQQQGMETAVPVSNSGSSSGMPTTSSGLIRRRMRTSWLRRTPLDEEDRDGLIALFDAIDRDDDDGIGPDDLIGALIETGHRVTTRDVTVLMKYADRDGNGILSRDEWTQLVQEITK